jgi:peptidoglycan-N-acetylglucosamine deacetylase
MWVQARVCSKNAKFLRLFNVDGGIVLFHDSIAQTAAMLPTFLRASRTAGYRGVHVVPASE